MSGIVKGVFVQENGSISVTKVKDELQNYYDLLKCQYIDIQVFKVVNFCFDVVCDDEGLLTSRKPTVFSYADNTPLLVGSVFICSHDEYGDLKSLPEEQINFILTYLRGFYKYKDEEGKIKEQNCILL